MVIDGGTFGANNPAIIRVNSVTGNRTLVSGRGQGSGPLWVSPQGIAIAANRQWIILDPFLGVVQVDSNNGNRIIISPSTDGDPPFVFPTDVAIEADGQLVVVDGFLGLTSVIRVNPVSGNRVIVSDANTGEDPLLLNSADIVVDTAGNLLVANSSIAGGSSAILRVNPINGDRTLVSDINTGIGPAFIDSVSLVIQTNDKIMVIDRGLAAIVQVDLTTGNRRVISQ